MSNSRAHRSSLPCYWPPTASGLQAGRGEGCCWNRAMTEHLCAPFSLRFYRKIKPYRKRGQSGLPVLPRMARSWCYREGTGEDIPPSLYSYLSVSEPRPLSAHWEGPSSALHSHVRKHRTQSLRFLPTTFLDVRAVFMSAKADDGNVPLGRVEISTKDLSILPVKLPSPPDAEFPGSVGASFPSLWTAVCKKQRVISTHGREEPWGNRQGGTEL